LLASIANGATTLRSGNHGDDVKAVQNALIQLGYSVGPVGADGIFGPDTAGAVARFQKARGRPPSGEVDRQTLLLLDAALATGLGPQLSQDYIVKPIADLRALDARTEATASDHDIRTVHPQEIGADIVTSGTFHTGHDPVGPLIQNGRWVTPGGWPHGRGGVAVLADGTVRTGFYSDPSEATVRATFERPGNPIREFMGGGALIIEEGAPASTQDLELRQRFQGGAAAPQFQPTARHTIIAVHVDEKPYLVVDVGHKPLPAIQGDLVATGFRNAVMFDGGNAFGYEDAQGCLFGRIAGWQSTNLSAAEVAALRGPHDVALTGFAIRTG